MQKLKGLSIANLILLLAHAGISYGTQSDIFNSQAVGDVSDKYPSLFTPSGDTFAIWGLIYTALLALCIRHVIIAFSKAPEHPGNWEIGRMGPWFIINNLLAIAWLYFWTNDEIMIATVLIYCQLLTLIIINLRLGIHTTYATFGSKAFTQFPLSIYFGWLTIATIANTCIYLVSNGWENGGLDYSPISWTRIMIGVAVVITLLVIFSRRNVWYGVIVIWALYGIIKKRNEAGGDDYRDIIQTAWIGMGIVAVACLIQLILNLSSRRRKESFPLAPRPLK